MAGGGCTCGMTTVQWGTTQNIACVIFRLIHPTSGKDHPEFAGGGWDSYYCYTEMWRGILE